MKLNKCLKSVIFIGGPTGSGKSTVVKSLRELGSVYLEEIHKNPYLVEFHESGVLNARQNQIWFLEQIEQFLEFVTTTTAIVDQHPFGIGFCYPKLFLENGMIDDADFEYILNRAEQIYHSLTAAGVKILTINLLAEDHVLLDRLRERSAGQQLSQEMVSKVNLLFQQISIPDPKLELRNDTMSVAEECSIIKIFIRSQL